MSDYRLYFFNREGHIAHAVTLDCRDDAHAVETVQQHRDGRSMELWERGRLVHRFEAGLNTDRPA